LLKTPFISEHVATR